MDQRPDQQRPRSKSTFSFKSDKSHGSNPNHDKHHHHLPHHHHIRESAEDKRKSHLTPHTKADPNAAMTEVQPIAAALEKPTLQSLRSFQHVDSNGAPIAEPDLSNPTRSRWERPLDTIRSFEAAIDGEYKRRSQAMRNDSSEMLSGYASRRSSYYGGNGGYDQNRHSQPGGYYGSRQTAMGRDGWDNGYGGQRNRYNRMQSDPYRYNNNNSNNNINTNNNVYPTQGYHQSRDTVITGGSNGSQSEPYSNEQGSENSSIEQRGGPVGPPPGVRPDLGEQYGFNGFGGGGPQPILEEYGNVPSGQGYFPPQQSQQQNFAPPVPAKTGQPQVAPIQLSQSNSNGQAMPANGPRPNVLSRKGTSQSGEKRQSWFKRRFSKN
ncbi:hypothetical protein BU24DRAFT_414295 [Aaosphaeria arxii CBS 175.79]|uniref:DUF2406 domain-containing protein n=1 Tax=Aaosphaeria arxii CBS 175.79 TaxID=1450172 RepID=A0A6A5XA91_9PLEO|nr:uncharacterized protein BU24DRAFT_414295 [Aaosphaeria arxii CBS 175.79]KAF2009833.1 hypothetical protein BU24DRAFT_414295 [Aaosphaeria arxii CBS 175.79]